MSNKPKVYSRQKHSWKFYGKPHAFLHRDLLDMDFDCFFAQGCVNLFDDRGIVVTQEPYQKKVTKYPNEPSTFYSVKGLDNRLKAGYPIKCITN